MLSKIRKIIIAGSIIALSHNVYAFKTFTLKAIEVKGLQRIKYGTLLSYVPINVGQRVTQQKADSIVRALYKTGFFTSVNVFKAGNNLIIEVQEKSTIASITVLGNKMIPSDQMNRVFEEFDLVKGRIFNEAVFTKIKDELERQYALQGHYGAHIEVEKRILKDNRIRVIVNIYEGQPARIREIEFKGNKHFSDSRLKSEMLLKTANIINWFLDKDRYSREKFEGSLEAIRSFYMDRGYIDVKIVKDNVLISPDKKNVFIKIKVNEGELFTFSGYKFLGKLPIKDELVYKEILFKKGETFSRKTLNETVKAITDRLGDYGYLPVVDAEPLIDRKAHQVFINFIVRTGPRVYVNRIQFSGNNKTADYVLRHSMRQHEAERFSVRHVRESERRLRILGYFEDVSSETTPVPGKNNQVDLNFKLKEKAAAKATLSAGYGANSGFQFSASVDQPNFLGTGRLVSVNFSTNNLGQNYSASYFNPYYYGNRIGRGFNFAYSKTKYGRRNDVEKYETNNFTAGVNYSIKLTDHANLQLGTSIDHLAVPTYQDSRVFQYSQFYQRNGERFDAIKLSTGLNYNSYNQFPFPTKGWHHSFEAMFAVPPTSSDLSYYKLFFRNQGYYPLPKEYVLTGGLSLGYADGLWGDDFPIYENFIAGGIGFAGQVRGYSAGSLGPRAYDVTNTQVNAIGGNVLSAANIGLVLPYPASQGTVRTTWFVDAGNVYSHNQPKAIRGVHPGPIRYSTGLSFDWRSPFGPMVISLSKALNEQKGDRTRMIDFSISTGF